MTDSPAPIALFAYKRPAHLRRTLEALAANAEARLSALHVFCDGPKSEADAAAVAEVREIARGAAGFATVQVHARERNAGLARSIIEGVGEMVEAHGRAIVVEDDLVVSPHFLRYMHEGLALYADDDQVASVHGYCYPLPGSLPETFFLRGADCWGWATWARAWRHFEADGTHLLAQLRQRGLAQDFDLDGASTYTRMLEDQIAGRNDSWAVRWHASAFLRGMLTLHPGRSLVANIGHDASGTHSGATTAYDVLLADRPIRMARLPLAEDAAARQAIAHFLRATQANAEEPSLRNIIRQLVPPVALDAARRLRKRLQGAGDAADTRPSIEMAHDGFSIALPADHMLPAYRARYPKYDAFLPILAAQLPAGSCVVDVGANCGDTLAAMAARNADLHYLCIEPDAAFFAYLTANAERIRARHPQLRVDAVQSLVGMAVDHVVLQGTGGTKHAVAGAGGARSTRLDTLLRDHPVPPLSLLKSDVDGFDYDVLLSGWQALEEQRPLVYFECQFDTLPQKNAYEDVVTRMQAAGYEDWSVFDNFGELLLRTPDTGALLQLMRYVWSQNRGRSARTVYYLDVCAATARDRGVVDRALKEHLTD